MLDIYDRLGVVVMDENRLFGNESAYVANMGAMVKRDRNHPSVTIWSFCNEGDCEGKHEAGGPAFQAISQEFDGSRPTLANMFTFVRAAFSAPLLCNAGKLRLCVLDRRYAGTGRARPRPL